MAGRRGVPDLVGGGHAFREYREQHPDDSASGPDQGAPWRGTGDEPPGNHQHGVALDGSYSGMLAPELPPGPPSSSRAGPMMMAKRHQQAGGSPAALPAGPHSHLETLQALHHQQVPGGGARGGTQPNDSTLNQTAGLPSPSGAPSAAATAPSAGEANNSSVTLRLPPPTGSHLSSSAAAKGPWTSHISVMERSFTHHHPIQQDRLADGGQTLFQPQPVHAPRASSLQSAPAWVGGAVGQYNNNAQQQQQQQRLGSLMGQASTAPLGPDGVGPVDAAAATQHFEVAVNILCGPNRRLNKEAVQKISSWLCAAAVSFINSSSCGLQAGAGHDFAGLEEQLQMARLRSEGSDVPDTPGLGDHWGWYGRHQDLGQHVDFAAQMPLHYLHPMRPLEPTEQFEHYYSNEPYDLGTLRRPATHPQPNVAQQAVQPQAGEAQPHRQSQPQLQPMQSQQTGQTDGQPPDNEAPQEEPSVQHAMRCHVCNTVVDAMSIKKYVRSRRICNTCRVGETCMKNGVVMRFCQLCSWVHPLEEFDGSRRSCRAELIKHNKRRRKKADTVAGNSDQNNEAQD